MTSKLMLNRTNIFLISGMCAVIILLAWCTPVSAEALRFDSMSKGKHEITFLLGYGENHKIPDATKDRFSLDTAKLRYGVFTAPRIQFGVCLAFGRTQGDQDNYTTWSTISYRRYFLVRGESALGYDFNLGIMRFQDQVAELGTKTNFTEQIGLTFEHGISSNSAITLEYVFSHTSNAGIKLPNIGINASMVAFGCSWFR